MLLGCGVAMDVALILPLAWELPYATGAAIKRKKNGESGHPCLLPNVRGHVFGF